MSEEAKIEITPELRMRALELAERTVTQPYYTTGSGGGGYRDKELSEIMRRADLILGYATNKSPETTSGLIEKLRAVLCPN